ncbi:protein sel-1 homolog 3 isoform X2 [Nelusetta ayraudi]|uniref:protein sel-1 homolog 3 isoform X2 n=1 Tax=Nelusetta ayraudi TaxID=303726 RepID=UPI003F6F8E69
MTFHTVISGRVLAAVILMGHCVLQTISISSSNTGENLPGNFIAFDSVPDRVGDGSALCVRYLCSGPCRLAVEVAVSTLRETNVVVFRRKWMSSASQVHRIRWLLVRWPPSILYQRDFFNRRELEARNATVRAQLDHLGEDGTHNGATLRIYKELPLPERLAKRAHVCLSWSAQVMWQITRDRPREQDPIDLLSFPLASTGEQFGVVRRFQPFIDRALEEARRGAVTRPSVTFSVWLYLLEPCRAKLCGIIHHMDGNDSYNSVLMQLTDAGDIIIQTRVTMGADEAFRTNRALPLGKWIRLDCYVQDSEVRLDTTWDDKTIKHVYRFRGSIHYDDTDGYFVIGGSRYLKGIRGYFGPIRYYRFGTKEVRNPPTTLHQMEKTLQECQEVREWTRTFVQRVTESHRKETGGCISPFTELAGCFQRNVSKQTWSWEEQLKHRPLFKFLQQQEGNIGTGSLGVGSLGGALLQRAIQTLFTVGREQNSIDGGSLDLLRASSCFGDHRASLLLAAAHLSGLAANRQLGHAYSLIGAAGDSRLALMHAGYKHARGIDGFPRDPDVAYGYYSNVGKQSNEDGLRMHEYMQYIPEHIYLSDEENLRSRDSLSSDVFEYMKLQAERGDVQAQRRLASMLFWGQHGISKDPGGAMMWFERSAMQMKDPSALYDYSILLMKGPRVTRNRSQGFRLMQKAAAMGSISAVNGLGWYHGTVLKEHAKALEYYQRAALNGGSADAVFNLGVYRLNGKHPRRPERNETAAFHYFLDAAQLGHTVASVEVAWYLATGSLQGAPRDADRAVTMLRDVCEQNGHLGFTVREALHAYLEGSRQEALAKYILAAETGLGLAQINAAHLCEELSIGRHCQLRYLGLAVLEPSAHPSALLKMGDYHYDGGRGDSLSSTTQAISMYGRAAVAGSPQGMFNLAVLVQRGHVVPLSVRGLFNVTSLDEQEVVVEKILQRCLQNEAADAASPCSVALLRVQMGKALSRVTQSGVQLVLACATLLSAAVTATLLLLQCCLGQKGSRQPAVGPRAETPHVSRASVSAGRERGGIMRPAARNQWLSILNGPERLQQAADWAMTLSGVCVCALWTTLLYHLL